MEAFVTVKLRIGLKAVYQCVGIVRNVLEVAVKVIFNQTGMANIYRR